MLKNLIWQLINIVNRKFFSPRIIVGYKRHDGKALAKTRISNTTLIEHPHKLNIEDLVYISHFCLLECSNGLFIGEGCQICSHSVITTHSSHLSIRLYGADYLNHATLSGYVTGSISIGKYSFIGPHVTIMPKTQIGIGSIVKAYSYVKGEFPDFAIIAGNPAVQIGDTRDLDKGLLNKYPHLNIHYNQWSS
jgi:acetyltransferase-like isoleucine patch superfamily enzyme